MTERVLSQVKEAETGFLFITGHSKQTTPSRS